VRTPAPGATRRRVSRLIRVGLIVGIVSASLSVVAIQAAEAATDTVTTCANSGPGSLPVVVGAAAPGDTVDFSVPCPPGSPITLASTITLSQDVTIAGPGASTLAVSGGGAIGVFAVNSGVTATISGITIESGSASLGGGISNDGALSVTDAVLSGDNANAGGGGIYNGSGATLDVTDSSFPGDDNYYDGGGGIQNNGSMDVVDSTFSNDSDYYGGGGIQNNASGTITGSTMTGASAYGTGGAVDNYGSLTVASSTISGNSAYYGGGGIYNLSNSLHIVNSTVTGNSASSGGGDIDNNGPMTIAATIVGSGSTPECSGVAGTTLGYNLDEDGSCGLTGPGDLSDTPAGLDPSGLQDNGGPTQTVALEPGSAAIDAVTDPSLCPSTDQRGYPRPVFCDIGAFDTDTATAPCTPGTTGCSATLTAPSQTVAVAGTKPLSTSAKIIVSVAPAVLSCQSFSYLAPVTTLTDTGLTPGTSVAVTDTVHNLPSKKGIVICYQPLEATPPPPVFLAKCHGAHFVAPCYKSVAEVSDSVVAQLELPAGDPRFHIGGETPSVTSYSPATARPGHPLTIKGENLSEVTGVTIGGVSARITKTAPTSVKVTVPAGAQGGVIVVSSSAGAARGPSVTVSGTRIPVHASNLKQDEHRRR
jgi:hypothetical protein